MMDETSLTAPSADWWEEAQERSERDERLRALAADLTSGVALVAAVMDAMQYNPTESGSYVPALRAAVLYLDTVASGLHECASIAPVKPGAE